MNDVQAIARLVGILAELGYDITEILDEARNNGDISPETWAEIQDSIANSEDAWERY